MGKKNGDKSRPAIDVKVGSQWKRMCDSVWYARNVSVEAA